MPCRTLSCAFSLVELSIVLVILGLLAGGVLSGQSLIRASELRAVAREQASYITATNAFRDKYFGIPGDFINAEQFWSKSTACGGTAANGTCNGNGDGLIDPSTAGNQSSERFQLWRQLALAGMIEGSYSGISGAAGARDSKTGTNVPGSKMSNGGWSAFNQTATAGDGETYARIYGNVFQYGANRVNSGVNIPNGPLLKPQEAWNVDTKIDDGKPATGKMVARFWNNLCAAADDGNTVVDNLVASYRLSDNTLQCAFYFTWQ